MGKDNKAFDHEQIRLLAEILSDTGLTEIEIEQDGMRVRVARGMPANQVVSYAPQPAAAPVAAAAPQAAVPAAGPAAGTVRSPMVGTAYMAPSPDEPPFVTVGADVKAGQTIMIIEAMKTMNQIPAPHAGKITAIHVGNGDPIEFDEPLMVIE